MPAMVNHSQHGCRGTSLPPAATIQVVARVFTHGFRRYDAAQVESLVFTHGFRRYDAAQVESLLFTHGFRRYGEAQVESLKCSSMALPGAH
jgi:hypothetical protein